MNSKIAEIRRVFVEREVECQRLVDLFSLLANKCRLRILCMLTEGEFCVTEITEAVLPGKLTSISQHLRILTLAGIVEKRRSQRKLLYRLKDTKIEATLDFLKHQYLNGE